MPTKNTAERVRKVNWRLLEVVLLDASSVGTLEVWLHSSEFNKGKIRLL